MAHRKYLVPGSTLRPKYVTGADRTPYTNIVQIPLVSYNSTRGILHLVLYTGGHSKSEPIINTKPT